MIDYKLMEKYCKQRTSKFYSLTILFIIGCIFFVGFILDDEKLNKNQNSELTTTNFESNILNTTTESDF